MYVRAGSSHYFWIRDALRGHDIPFILGLSWVIPVIRFRPGFTWESIGAIMGLSGMGRGKGERDREVCAWAGHASRLCAGIGRGLDLAGVGGCVSRAWALTELALRPRYLRSQPPIPPSQLTLS